MPIAEQVYVDPSALRAMYLHDDRSRRFCAWRGRTKGALPLTRFGRTELVNAIHLGVHRGDVDHEQAAGAIGDLDDDLRAGRLALVDLLWRRTLDLAAELSERHAAKLGTRTLDVLHVAGAVTLGLTHFVTYDAWQAALARAAALRVLSP